MSIRLEWQYSSTHLPSPTPIQPLKPPPFPCCAPCALLPPLTPRVCSTCMSSHLLPVVPPCALPPPPPPLEIAAHACLVLAHTEKKKHRNSPAWNCGLAVQAAHLSEESRLCEVCDPLWGYLALRQAELHLQHSMRKAGDVCAGNGLVGVPIPPAPTDNQRCGDTALEQ